MFLTGAALLDKNKALIDSLNVFPVPDGDTGTNMFMTMQGAVKEIKECKGDTVAEVAAAASLGSLKGARGNSGVILSQILRGFSRALAGAEEMDAALLAQALKTGTEAAYKAVMKPKEGTMLTVSRMISDAVAEAADEGANVYKLIDLMLESGETALRITPDLLPVLREAGVVDSGGKGLITIFRGFKMAIDGEEVEDYVDPSVAGGPMEEGATLEDLEEIKFGYCTEFICSRDTKKDPELLRGFSDYRMLVYAIVLILVMLLTNSPILSNLVGRLYPRLHRRSREKGGEAT